MSQNKKIKIMGAFALRRFSGLGNAPPWLKAQSAVPSTLWLQPSGGTEGKTQNEMQNIMMHSFYSSN
jgi:hypothetical protein